jgi:pimeloyl-ACP methyl ester carboxylesterase
MNRTFRRLLAAAGAGIAAAHALAAPLAPPALEGVSDAYFFVGGSYDADGPKQFLSGQMYVRHLKPTEKTKAFPIVMVHGTGQTGTNFLGTPDGRPGWAQFFAAKGYDVYVVDQVGRGRSGQSPESYGPYMRLSTYDMASIYTGQENYRLFPQANLHTQWPGGPGVPGNAAFDQFYASQVESIASGVRSEELNDPALIALLVKVGPAILLTHSQAGVFGWKVADSRPDLVKAIIAVEPNGPPFYDVDFKGGSDWYTEGTKPARPWGITRVPLNFVPAASSPSDMLIQHQEQADGPDLVRCNLQGGAPRQLPSLAKVPIVIVTSESSFRATMDHCTSKFLTQAGVPNEHLRLASVGLHGNGHMMMLEKNNLDVAGVLADWIHRKVE